MPIQETIQIEWNGKPESVREGAPIESLLSEEELEKCQTGQAIIKDGRGHEVGLRGAITRGERLYLHYLSPTREKENT